VAVRHRQPCSGDAGTESRSGRPLATTGWNMNALDTSVQPLPHDRRFRDRRLVDHVDNADCVVLDQNVEIGNPVDAPQPAPAIN